MDAPSDYKTAGIFMLISGITNVLWGGLWCFSLIWLCIGVFWLIPLAIGIFEIVTAATILQERRTHQAKGAAIGGIVASVLCFNVIGIIMEVLAIVWLGKPEVEAWLREPAV